MKILILCTGNSCRSQMAHGIIENINKDFDVFSAGTKPAERVNPIAVKVMDEIGIDISSHTPHNVSDYLGMDWDYVITVCGGANESCPSFSGKVANRVHIGFDDPSELSGDQMHILQEFRRVRDEIRTCFIKMFGKAEECLVCKAPLEYLSSEREMECEICHKREMSQTRCSSGHYVCNDCHTNGIGEIIGFCLNKKDCDNPLMILRSLMDMDFCHMHGPEHHILVGASLLTAYYNAGGNIDLYDALKQMIQRGKKVPGGVCGFWGACGAAISSGMFVSIVTASTPLSQEPWGLSNLMTSKSLELIGKVGGPRCCKRNSYLATIAAVQFSEEHLGIKMSTSPVVCSQSRSNNQCIRSRCPFFVE